MTGKVRQSIDQDALERYLAVNVPEIKIPINLHQFSFGQSNPTYLITATDKQKFVLRKKPPGKLLHPKAHPVEREYQILLALESSAVPVPKPYHLCEDPSVVGSAFYIMEYVEGRIFENQNMPDVKDPAERKALWRDAVRVLAQLHAIDPVEVGLEKLGRGHMFYDRQVRTLLKVCEQQARARDRETGEELGGLPYVGECGRYLSDRSVQPMDRLAIVHGDFKWDNLVFHKTEPRVIAILDWENSTIGHPLSDITYLIIPYYLAKRRGVTPYDIPSFLPGRTPGQPPVEQLLRWYSEDTGYNVMSDYKYGVAFNCFRSAVVVHGVAARIAMGQSKNKQAQAYAKMRRPLAELAWEITQQAMRAHMQYAWGDWPSAGRIMARM